MTITIMISLYLIYIFELDYLILTYNNNNTQSYYLSEGKIYMCLYKDEYYINQLYPIILDEFRKESIKPLSRKVILNKKDLENGDTYNKISIDFVDRDMRKNFQIVAESKWKEIYTKVTSYGTLVNHFFEMKLPILGEHFLIEESLHDFNELLDNIIKNIDINNCGRSLRIFGLETIDYETIVLNKVDKKNYQIQCFRNDLLVPRIENFSNNEVFIVIKNQINKPINLIIGSQDAVEDKIDMNGIIYVEGDIIISSAFNFNGILIVNNGIITVESKEKPNMKGIILLKDCLDHDVLENKIDILYDSKIIYKYGTYLPGFIEPKIDVIKIF